MRLFGIDITGNTFGISGVNSTIDEAEEHFIRPEKICHDILRHSPKAIVRSYSAEAIQRKHYENSTTINEDIFVSQNRVKCQIHLTKDCHLKSEVVRMVSNYF